MPVTVIPQIVLAGVIAPLTGAAEWLAVGGATCYWAQQALERLLPAEWPRLLGRDPRPFGASLAVVATHAAVFLAAALALLSRRRPG